MRVAVIGASGYAGGELLRLIAGHPDLELVLATAGSSAGKLAGQVHQNLAGHPDLADLIFKPQSSVDDLRPAGGLQAAGRAGGERGSGAAVGLQAEGRAVPAGEMGCDLVFLALPSGQSAPVACGLADGIKVVDLGADFRLSDQESWHRHYEGDHAGRWVTGLPELAGNRKIVADATHVAAPGCYATAAILALAPLVAAGLVSCDDVVVVAVSGTSGAGRSLRANLLASEVMGSVSAYQAGGTHRHTPEIEQALAEVSADLSGALPRVSFTPMLAPMPRGILATCTAPLAAPGIDTAALHAALAQTYASEPFVRVLPGGVWPGTAAVAGSNGAHLQVAADQRTGRATVVSAIDNLGKGAAGQAVQNANLMLGLPETAGLTSIGVAP
jgi:N-acetyl-gamma-glutamyl-phosphate reductase